MKFYHLTMRKQMIFDWIVSDTLEYLEPFNFIDLC